MQTKRRRIVGALLMAVAPMLLHAQEGGRYGHYEVYDADLFPRAEYAARRQKVLAQLEQGSAMLVRSADEKNRSGDVEYPFRQRNSMLYLSGVTELGSALLLTPRPVMIDGAPAREILFVSRRDPNRESWTGIMLGPEVASKVSGIAAVLPFDALRGVLDTILPSLTTLYYDDWVAGPLTDPLTGGVLAFDREMKTRLPAGAAALQIRPVGPILHPMRQIKSPAEQGMLRRAAQITAEAHRETIRSARPGMHEYELQATMEYHFMRLGAEAPGYPSIVGSGPNSCILHYESNRRATAPGDLVLMDCGAELHGYSADVTRTFPISGHFTPEQRAIYDIVLQAQAEGIELCRDGNDFRDPHRKAMAVIAAGLMRLGIISEQEEAERYFFHGTSHFLGMDVHDVGRMGKLADGMVLTVEPGIYIPAGSPCDPKWWNIGIRIEDDILVTSRGPDNLSAGVPRAPEEIERLMQQNP